MAKKFTILVLGFFLIAVSLACASTATEPAPTPDNQATIDAAIAATTTAQSMVTVDPTTTVTPESTPQHASEDYSIYSEEELVAEIDTAVEEATTASEQTEAAIDTAAEDGTITQEEYDELVIYIDDLAEAVLLAEDLIAAYYGYYGDLAEDTLYLLQEIDDDLDDLYAFTEEMIALLIEVEAALDAGLDVAEETINQLVVVAENAQARRLEIIEASTTWQEQVIVEIESRATELLQVIPSEIPANRADALLAAFAYVDEVRAALSDQKISPQELAAIAQLGANAAAGLQNNGGPKLQGLSPNINDITTQLARGQVPQAKASLGALEGALGKRPGQ